MLAVVFAVMMQQAAPGAVIWADPAVAPPVIQTAPVPAIPESARADPYGYERAECSPLIRSASETMEACQARVRAALAANLGAALPPGLAPSGATGDDCRQEAAGDRYALQCGTPSRPDRPATTLTEQTCETRPQARPQGGVSWTETCRPADGRAPTQDGVKIRLGGND